MQILYFFESIRNPFLDAVMSAVTYLGHEAGFLLLALLLFWCIDKKTGYYVISVGLTGISINQILKMIFRVPRPWVLDPNFTIVESARSAAQDYSFPSGHTQCAVGLFGSLARRCRDKRIMIPSIVIAVLVPITRLYLGVHTIYDVSFSIVFALIMVFAFYPVFFSQNSGEGRALWIFILSSVLTLGLLLFVTLFPFPADTDPGCLSDAVKNAYTLMGASLGLLHTYYLDSRYLHFETKAPLPAQILKVVLGAAVVLLVKEGFKIPINALAGLLIGGETHAGDILRYYLVAITIGALWPLTFPRLTALFTKKNNIQ